MLLQLFWDWWGGLCKVQLLLASQPWGLHIILVAAHLMGLSLEASHKKAIAVLGSDFPSVDWDWQGGTGSR